MPQVALIRPPRIAPVGAFSAGAPIPPIGIAYLAAQLEKESISTQSIDGLGEDLDQFYRIKELGETVFHGLTPLQISSLISSDAQIIGFSCMFTTDWIICEETIRQVRIAFPHALLIAGGEHISAEAKNSLLLCPELDVCVLGEGEATLSELASLYLSNKPFQHINGIAYRRSDGTITINSRRERIANLDSIPSPRWVGIPVSSYLDRGYAMTTVGRRSMPIIASRGCPYRCTFCTSPQMWGTDLNLRSPALVIEEIKQYYHLYGIDNCDFLDIVGVLNRKWIKELLERLIDTGLPITWMHGAGTRSEILDDEILALIKRSGVLRVFYAPETGSKTTAKRIKKNINLEKMIRSMKTAHRLGISMRAPLIYGFPDQTIKEALENVWFSFRLAAVGVDDVVAHSFSAHPGSELYHNLVMNGSINLAELVTTRKYNEFFQQEKVTKISGLHSWSAHIPNWLLPILQTGVMGLTYMISFVFHPRKFLATIQRVFIDRKPLTLLDHVLFSKLIQKRKDIEPIEVTIKSPTKSLTKHLLNKDSKHVA